MLMTEEIARLRLARGMNDLERTLDRALADATSVIADVAKASHDVGAPLAEAHETILRLNQGLQAIITARGSAVRAHQLMINVARDRGLITMDMPDLCPSQNKIDGDAVEISAAAA